MRPKHVTNGLGQAQKQAADGLVPPSPYGARQGLPRGENRPSNSSFGPLAHGFLRCTKFTLGEALDVSGVMTPAYGFEHDGVFIVNPYASDCGRFHADPLSAYQLTPAEARELADLNAARDLLAYWDL